MANWPFEVEVTRKRLWLAPLGLISGFLGVVFFIYPSLIARIIGSIFLFIGISWFIHCLKQGVEFNSDQTKEVVKGLKADKPLNSSRSIAYEEYRALLDGLNRRGSQIHTAFSILIAASILAVTPLFQENGFVVNSTVTVSAALPIVSIILILSTIWLYVTGRKLDDISWRRINYLESLLGDENHPWLGHRWLNQMNSKKRILPRHLVWTLLLAAFLTFYIILEVYILSINGSFKLGDYLVPINFTIDPASIIIAVGVLILAFLTYNRSYSPPDIKLIFNGEESIKGKNMNEQSRFNLQFFVHAFFMNSGGTIGSVLDVYPTVEHPDLKLGGDDSHENKTYWYQMNSGPAKAHIEAKVMQGHSTLPLQIEIRLFFTTKEDADKVLGLDKKIGVCLHYKWSSTNDGGKFRRDSKTYNFILDY